MKDDSMKIANSSLSEGSNMGIFKLEKVRNENLRNTMATLYSSSAPSSRWFPELDPTPSPYTIHH